jgi:tetratricopeptide (TPR) repeat protein
MSNEIDDLMDESNSYNEKGDLPKSIELLIKAWDGLPEPKASNANSFFILKYIIETNLEIGKPEESEKWLKDFFESDLDRDDLGDRKYIEGKVAFDLGDMNRAKKAFIEANSLTKGRCFEPGDSQYKAIIK